MINLISYIPEYLQDIAEFKVIMDVESKKLDEYFNKCEQILDFQFVDYMDIETLKRYEMFLGIKGEGTVEQRRAYIKALYNRRGKLNETSIKDTVKAITGGKAIVHFYTADEELNPEAGQGLLLIRVLSPDQNVDYKFDDIERAILPYKPAHIKINIVKYFTTWNDISTSYADWNDIISNFQSWQELKDYIPDYNVRK